MNPLLIARLVMIGIGVAAIGWIYYIHTDRIELQESLLKTQGDLDAANQSIADNKRNQELEAWARTQYINELEEAKRENERIEKCIADKSCVATIRVRVPTACPGGSGSNNSSGASDIAAQLSPDSLRARSRLEANIKEWEAKTKLCIKTLKNWETKKSP